MKEYSLSKPENDKLSSLFAIFAHYQIVMQTMDKELKAFIVGDVFPRLGLTPEDFPFVNVNIREGKVSLDDVRQKEAQKGPKEPKGPVKDKGWDKVKAEEPKEPAKDEGWEEEADEKPKANPDHTNE